MSDDDPSDSGGGIPNPFKDAGIGIPEFPIQPPPRETEVVESQLDTQNELMGELINEV